MERPGIRGMGFAMTEKTKRARGLMLIAAFKLLKGLALLALGIGALNLLHKDVAAEAARWIDLLRIDPQNHYIQQLLAKIGRIDARKLKALSIGTFLYSGVFLTEGVGLFLQKRWAEYVTIFTTASLLPVEVYEVVKEFSTAKIVVLLINIAVVVYLVNEVRRTQNTHR
jgi:uncharacterized membrane protein (DUF2068 family)